jgi:hypothetical protein
MPFDPSTVTPSTAQPSARETHARVSHHLWLAPYSSTSGGNPVYDSAHELWGMPGVAPIARVRCDAQDLPPGYSSYAYTAAGAAEGVANWVEYSVACARAAGRELGRYGFYIQNSGEPPTDVTANRTNTVTLCRHWSDRVVDVEVTDAAAVNTPWCENGIAGLQAWMVDFLNALDVELVARNLPAPNDLHWDFEGRVLAGSALPLPTGFWAAMQADNRWDTNSIDGNPANTMANLWAAARTSTGAAMTLDTASGMFTQANAEFEAWLTQVYYRASEYALAQAVYEPARAKFPGIQCGNYAFVPRLSNQTWYRVSKAYSPRTQYASFDLPLSDYAVAVAYPITNSAIDANSPGRLADWFEVYGLEYTGDAATDYRTFNIEYTKADLRAQRSYYTGPLSVWNAYPDYPVTYTNPAHDYTVTTADIIDVGQYAAGDLGITDCLWFMNSGINDDTGLPYLANTNAYPAIIRAVNEAAERTVIVSSSVRYSRRRARRRMN